MSEANQTLPDGPQFDRICRDVAAAKPSRLVAKMNEVYKQCPKVKRIEFVPNVRMDTERGRTRIDDWEVWLWTGLGRGISQLIGSGSDCDLDTAIAEAVAEYLAEYGPSKPAAEVESDNAAALEEVDRWDEATGPMGGGK